MIKLGKIGDFSSAGVDKNIINGEVPVLLLNFLDVYNLKKIDRKVPRMKSTAPIAKVGRCNIEKGDVFFTPSSELPDDIGQSAVAIEDIPGAVYSYHIIRLRPKILIDSDFLGYALESKNYFNQTIMAAEGSGKRYVISYKKFAEIEIFVPDDIEEQRRIAQVLGDIDDEIATLEELVAKKRLVKTAVMQQLLTGKVRLTADGRAVTGADIERERELGDLHDWRRVKLGEIGMIITGKTPSTVQSAFWHPEEIDFVTPGDLKQGRELLSCERKISKAGYKSISTNALSGNSVLVGCIGSDLGNVVMSTKICATNQQINSLTQFNDDTSPSFIYYWLYTQKEYLMNIAGNTATPIINKVEFSEIEIDLPSYSEQTRIAGMLTDIDDDISIHEKLISKKRQVKTGVMQQLLTGKIRLLEAA